MPLPRCERDAHSSRTLVILMFDINALDRTPGTIYVSPCKCSVKAVKHLPNLLLQVNASDFEDDEVSNTSVVQA
jgi:hypothetical protein